VARIEIGQHLAIDPRVCGGRLIFKGTRILVYDAIEMIRLGMTPRKVAREYRGLITPAAVSEAVSLVRRGLVREIDKKPAA
jgi:uncharacterized protein (DUF433 family)